MGDFDAVKGVAAPARRALASAGVKNVGDLARFTEAEVSAWHGIGPTAMVALKKLMSERNLGFRPE